MPQDIHNSFQDVRQYPADLLQILEKGVCVPVTYKKTWDDGFGARGWKLDATIGDPEIIASTRETGQTISTSVFIHDILDHFLSGFSVSGHRSEAMALIQLSKRTNSDPTPDYEQMVKEDIEKGRVNGETLATFIPNELKALIPGNLELSDKELISYLKQKIGDEKLRKKLVKHFFALGNAGNEHAINNWLAIGLDPDYQTEMGLALQNLLEIIDSQVEKSGIEKLKGFIKIDNEHVKFIMKENYGLDPINNYQVSVA
jgi:hypothetical protein